MENNKTDIIIVGSGTTGLTAAIYALRAGKNVFIFDYDTPGGKITTSYNVENYPGILSITGEKLGENMVKQVDSFGGIFIKKSAESLNAANKSVTADSKEYFAKSIIIATGMRNRKSDAKNSQKFEGLGISYCAVCDGPIFKGKSIAVIGGGNSALTEALYLADICDKVYLIHRKPDFKAESHLINKINEKQNIIKIMNTVVTSFNGDSVLRSIDLLTDGQKKSLDISAAFPAIGYIPQNELYKDIIATDSQGFAVTDENCTTNVPGIFVAGDCRQKPIRQLTTAAADGTVAAFNACRYLENS